MKESWGSETLLCVTYKEADEGELGIRNFTENGEAANPLLISLEETSEGDSDSADWPANFLSAVEETLVEPRV
jgi:hypothetical protein